MKRRLTVLAGLISAGLVICGGSPAIAATSAPSARLAPAGASPVPGWGRAQPVPGTSAASGAGLQGVSCAPGGTCTAIGDYDATSASGKIPFAITGENGVWGQKQPLPGLAAFAPQGAEAQALDCPASGDCLIAGSYQFGTDVRTYGSGVYVQEEVNGTWGTPAAVPGSVLTGAQGFAEPTGVSCASPGNCLLVGLQVGVQDYPQTVFIAQETGYQWSAVAEVPGLSALNVEGFAEPAGQSCPAPGDCVVTGYYATDTPAGAVASRPFAAVEADGTWQAAAQVILPALSPDGTGTANSLSCPAVGKCVIAGAYQPAVTASPSTGFVVTQTPAGWSAPVTFPGVAIDAISCPSAGNCAATAQDDTANVADVTNEVHGTWGKVSPLPGVTGLSYNGEKAAVSEIFNLVCPSAGNCTAAGTYFTNLSASPPAQNVFVASEVGGKWWSARVPAGLLALNTAGYASVAGLDCAAAANCVVGGDYDSTAADQGAFLLAEVPRPG
jgi:hypothetical protein